MLLLERLLAAKTLTGTRAYTERVALPLL